MKTRQVFAAVISIGMWFGLPAWSADLIRELEFYAQENNVSKRVGLEVELAGLPLLKIATILQNTLGGISVNSSEDYSFVNEQSGEFITLTTHHTHIKLSSVGDIEVKPEDNAPTHLELLETMEKSDSIVEIVSRPLRENQIPLFQSALDRLKQFGGEGTTDTRAVALQVNVEMGNGDPRFLKPKNILNIIKNYLSEENRPQIESHLQVPEIRKRYVGKPPAGFLKRINRADYNPTWDQFYMDAMYRASLEDLGVLHAWTMSDDEARATLRNLLEQFGFEIINPAMKWQYVRYSSLLMFMRPDEWFTKYLLSTNWYKPAPILEFREPNNDFNAAATTRWILALVHASEKIGSVSATTLEEMRAFKKCAAYL